MFLSLSPSLPSPLSIKKRFLYLKSRLEFPGWALLEPQALHHLSHTNQEPHLCFTLGVRSPRTKLPLLPFTLLPPGGLAAPLPAPGQGALHPELGSSPLCPPSHPSLAPSPLCPQPPLAFSPTPCPRQWLSPLPVTLELLPGSGGPTLPSLLLCLLCLAWAWHRVSAQEINGNLILPQRRGQASHRLKLPSSLLEDSWSSRPRL